MDIRPLLLAFAVQAPLPTNPHDSSEWELLTHLSVWGAPEEPWRDVAMWPGVVGGETLSGPYWSEPHIPSTPIELRRWSVVNDTGLGDAATLLAGWFLDPDAKVPLPEEPDPRKPKRSAEAARTPWSNLLEPGDGRYVCAFSTFSSPRDEIRVARVSGARWFLWNGEPFLADRDRRGFEGVPVHVKAGVNRVFIAADGESFDFVLHEPRSTVYVERFDIVWPEGKDALGDELGMNVFNASLHTVQRLCIHYGHVSGWSATCTPELREWRDSGYIAPLCLHRRSTYYSGFTGECPISPDVDHGCQYNAISVFTTDGSPAERLLLRRGSEWEARRPNNQQCVQRSVAGESLTLSDLFAADAVLVYASREREAVSLAQARVLQQDKWYRRGHVPIVARDVDVKDARNSERSPLSWPLEKSRVVLHGNAWTNVAWSNYVADTAPAKVTDGRVEFSGRVHDGDDLAGWYIHDEAKKPGYACLFDTGPKGARLGLLLATTWSGPRTSWAVFRVDASDPRGWKQIDGENMR